MTTIPNCKLEFEWNGPIAWLSLDENRREQHASIQKTDLLFQNTSPTVSIHIPEDSEIRNKGLVICEINGVKQAKKELMLTAKQIEGFTLRIVCKIQFHYNLANYGGFKNAFYPVTCFPAVTVPVDKPAVMSGKSYLLTVNFSSEKDVAPTAFLREKSNLRLA